MNLIIIEFDSDLRNFIRDIFHAHTTQCFQHIADLNRGHEYQNIDYIILDTDHNSEQCLHYLRELEKQKCQFKIIGLSTQNKPDLLEQKLVHLLLKKPNILPLLDIAAGRYPF